MITTMKEDKRPICPSKYYRILVHDADGEFIARVHEVYYGEDLKLKSYCPEPISMNWNMSHYASGSNCQYSSCATQNPILVEPILSSILNQSFLFVGKRFPETYKLNP